MAQASRIQRLLLLTFLAAATPSIARSDEIPGWAQFWLGEWYDAYNRRDADALVRLYTEDAHVNQWRGRAALGEGIKQDWSEDDLYCVGRWSDFKVIGDTAVGWGDDTCRPVKGQAEPLQTEWLSVFERQPNGAWLENRSVWQEKQ